MTTLPYMDRFTISTFRVQEREQRLETQLRGAAKETLQVRSELGRMEAVNNNLQGYGLDNLHDEGLANLVNSLAQAMHS